MESRVSGRCLETGWRLASALLERRHATPSRAPVHDAVAGAAESGGPTEPAKFQTVCTVLAEDGWRLGDEETKDSQEVDLCFGHESSTKLGLGMQGGLEVNFPVVSLEVHGSPLRIVAKPRKNPLK